jgi:hypothetical protein
MNDPIYEEGPVKIYYDHHAINPRQDMEYTSTLYCHNLINEGPAPSDHDHIWLPVYRYEHSGTALNTTGFHCPWDSGLTGYIYEDKAQIREEFEVKRISPKLRSRIEDRLRSEVAIYGAYVNGEVYGYVNEETDDSCWGFFGTDWDYMMQEARAA